MPMIRIMTKADITACLAIAHEVHPATLYKHIPIDNTEAALTMIQHIEADSCLAMVCELDGAIAGFMLGSMQQLMFSREQIALDTTIVVEPGSRGLGIATQMLGAFTAWGQYKGARLICISSSSGERVNAEGLKNYKQAGTVLMREVHL